MLKRRFPLHFSVQEKSGVLGGMLKRSPKPGHVRRPSQVKQNLLSHVQDGSFTQYALSDSCVFQDLLDNEFTASNDSLSENTTTKVSLIKINQRICRIQTLSKTNCILELFPRCCPHPRKSAFYLFIYSLFFLNAVFLLCPVVVAVCDVGLVSAPQMFKLL